MLFRSAGAPEFQQANRHALLALLLSLLIPSFNLSYAKDIPTIKLTVPVQGNQNDGYFIELISEAFTGIGVKTEITELEDITRKRQVVYLQDGRLSLVWRLRNKWRDDLFQRVDVGLTNGYIGKRVFLIPKGTQSRFNKIRSLDDFAMNSLVGVFGENWYDADIWQFNGLPQYQVSGSRDKIYAMLAGGNRGVDYFSRGIIQVEGEAAAHPALDIESGLLLEYDSDYYLYLNSALNQHAGALAKSLEKMKRTGRIEQLLEKHYGDLENRLNLSKRRKLKLEVPE